PESSSPHEAHKPMPIDQSEAHAKYRWRICHLVIAGPCRTVRGSRGRRPADKEGAAHAVVAVGRVFRRRQLAGRGGFQGGGHAALGRSARARTADAAAGRSVRARRHAHRLRLAASRRVASTNRLRGTWCAAASIVWGTWFHVIPKGVRRWTF